MQQRLAQGGLLVGGAAILVGQYLYWAVPRTEAISNYFGAQGSASVGLPNLLTGRDVVSGWAADAVLFALVLVVLVLVAFARPETLDELPLGFAVLGTCVFVAASGQGVRRYADLMTRETGEHFRLGAGVFVTAGGLLVSLAAIGWLRRDRVRRPRLAELVVPVIGVTLLGSLFLPWERFSVGPLATTAKGFDEAPGFALALLALVLVTGMRPPDLSVRAGRLVFAIAAVVVVAGMSLPTLDYVRAYGVWVGLGLAIALVLAVVSPRGIRRTAIDRTMRWPLALSAVTALLLFLPWERTCFPTVADGPLGGSCPAYHGWSFPPGVANGMFVVAWAIGVGVPRIARVEVALLAAALVSTIGFEISPVQRNDLFSIAWGGIALYVAVGLLVVSVLAHSVMRGSLSDRLGLRLVPLALCTAYLVVVVVPWWHVLPSRIDEALRFGNPSWLTIPCVAVAVRLARLWGDSDSARESLGRLTFLPLFLFAVATASAVEAHRTHTAFGWGGGAVLGLAGLLILAGWVEEHGGLEGLRVPEILRIDRI